MARFYLSFLHLTTQLIDLTVIITLLYWSLGFRIRHPFLNRAGADEINVTLVVILMSKSVTDLYRYILR